ncbi:Basic-leucine zipper (bZIP) transcription factor [Metarhizium album ARSEF 1941]|uniref:Basic-leucine zipper (BZIP) transcription factor n=1 Tax=Metarhizium album (strain ARSEF 1941) TaxID=1081103 RepID=A0A0B2X195_METAS|nr:Basic-leucine zipper (bZIP) transcription factor [Metarhizium album ARSEF 1941]KHN99644.1 Basic-leucine zipper (bZIP) transcription factor [Metarhizium album ARSEF 1941]
MSQRDTSTRPASRPTSTSPTTSAEKRARPFGQSVGSHDAPNDTIKVLPKENSNRSQQVRPTSLGMLNILNPSDSRSRDSHVPQISSAQVGQPTGGYSTWTNSFPRQPGSGHSSSASYPEIYVANTNFGLGSERHSPTAGYPFPNMNEPRKTLGPKISRHSSVSQSSGRPGGSDHRPPGYGPSASPAKRTYEAESADERRQLPSLCQTPGIIHMTGPRVLTPPPRSLSQPGNRAIESSYVQAQAAPPRDIQALPSHPQFQLGQPQGPLPSVSQPPESPPWTEVMRRSAGSGSLEGQQAYMTLPGSDVPIPVQVDYSQASRKADEKRQRNAKASTRHRRKKKTMQEENVRQLQELKDERQQMSEEMEYLRRQRDFYREDRNRLRDIISRTPGIHQHAAGPRSPTPTRSIDSHTDHSPVSQHLMPTPTQGYSSDAASAMDRAAQRPKMEERVDFARPGPSTTPVGLAPPHGHLYNVPPRPASAASSGSGDRLPPLRAMEGPSTAVQHVGSGQAQEQDPRTGQWRPVPPRQVETGWATGFRKTGNGQTHPW